MGKTELTFNWQMFIFCLLALLFVILLISLFVIPVKMANKRGRSGFMWLLFSLVFSPFISMLFLALLGETDQKRKQRILEEEDLRMRYRS